MIIEVLLTQLLHPAVVGVADERHRTVGLCVGGHELEHAFESRPAFRRDADAGALERQIGGQKQLEHEAVIRSRRFVVDAVLVHLRQDLLGEDGVAGVEPAAAVGRIPEQDAEQNQPDTVAEIMVAVDVRGFEVSSRRIRRGCTALAQSRGESPGRDMRPNPP